MLFVTSSINVLGVLLMKTHITYETIKYTHLHFFKIALLLKKRIELLLIPWDCINYRHCE